MKTKTLLFVTAFLMITNIFAQKGTIELSFTAINIEVYQQLDSVKVINKSEYLMDTVLYFPDTIFILEWLTGTNAPLIKSESFQVFQNYPNPVKDQTTVSMYIPEKDEVDIRITDILGSTVLRSKYILDKGHHSFRFKPGHDAIYFFTACFKGLSSTIKILNINSQNYNSCSLTYSGSDNGQEQLKDVQSTLDFTFYPGDILLYVGYSNGLESGITNSPTDDIAITFQFATNIPCPGTPEVEYEGEVYPTIQIFSQCWLKKSLNVGVMIPSNQEMLDNDTIEKYCPENNPAYCDSWHGALYDWDEIMQYDDMNEQGICPPGWHMSSDQEWKILEGAADSQYGIGDYIWTTNIARGFDVGTNLKSTTSWLNNGNGVDLFQFWGLPSGYRDIDGSIVDIGWHGCFWTRTKHVGLAYGRYISYDLSNIGKSYYDTAYGFSLRCLKD